MPRHYEHGKVYDIRPKGHSTMREPTLDEWIEDFRAGVLASDWEGTFPPNYFTEYFDDSTEESKALLEVMQTSEEAGDALYDVLEQFGAIVWELAHTAARTDMRDYVEFCADPWNRQVAG